MGNYSILIEHIDPVSKEKTLVKAVDEAGKEVPVALIKYDAKTAAYIWPTEAEITAYKKEPLVVKKEVV